MTEYGSILLDDPLWIVAVKGLLIFALCVLLTLMAIPFCVSKISRGEITCVMF